MGVSVDWSGINGHALILALQWERASWGSFCIIPGQCYIITINEPVDYMAWAVMILMAGKDIMLTIGRGGP